MSREPSPPARRTSGRRISAREWKARGGLRNGKLYRVQARNGRWRYYES